MADSQTGSTTLVPRELGRSTPRPVRLSATGRLVAVLAGALAIGAVVAFAGLVATTSSERALAAAFAADGRVIEAEITRVRRADNSGRRVEYRYEVAGGTFGGSARFRARDGYAVGDRLAIVYLPDRPAEHYVEARGYRSMPFWLVPSVPAVLLFVAAVAWRALRSQRHLLESGRPVVASVTGSKKQTHQHGSYFKVSYEFRLMSGSSRHGSYSVQKDPPGPGTPVVVLYDREHPERNRKYPTSLVRLAVGE